jgi:hypothetical protein
MWLLASQAGAPVTSFEVENGNLSSSASIVNDQTASNQKAVKFASGTAAGERQCPAYPDFPNAGCTGVPPGITLTNSGSITVTQDGAVIDAKNITGQVIVQASNVTIKNSRITGTGGKGQYPVHIQGGTGLVIQDTEILQAPSVNANVAVICCSNFKLVRVHIHDFFEGVRMANNVAIEESYIHTPLRCDASCHIDVLQSTQGNNILVKHNRLDAYNYETKDYMNAAYQFGEEQGRLTNCRFENNFFNGGNYTLNGGGGGTTGADCDFYGNRFGFYHRYGPKAYFGPNVSFDSSNVWHETGMTVPQVASKAKKVTAGQPVD